MCREGKANRAEKVGLNFPAHFFARSTLVTTGWAFQRGLKRRAEIIRLGQIQASTDASTRRQGAS